MQAMIKMACIAERERVRNLMESPYWLALSDHDREMALAIFDYIDLFENQACAHVMRMENSIKSLETKLNHMAFMRQN